MVTVDVSCSLTTLHVPEDVNNSLGLRLRGGETEPDERNADREATATRAWKRFTETQKDCLDAFYRKGMTSTRKQDLHIISQAAKDANLTNDQVKRYIKKRNFNEKHNRTKGVTVTVTQPAKKPTPWQIYQKQYGESDAGQEAMKLGVGKFNKAASAAYKELGKKEKERLKELAATTAEHTGCRRMNVKKAAAKIFNKIQSQCEKLSKLGYKAAAFGFSEFDVQTASTADCASAMTPEVVDHMRSVLDNGQPTTPFSPPQAEQDSDNSCESDCQPDSQSMEAVSPSLADEAQLFDMSPDPTDHEFTTPPTTPTDATAHPHRYSSESSSPSPTSPCTSNTVPATLSSKLHSSSPEYTVSPGPQLSSYDTKSVLRLEYLGHFQPAAFTYSLSDSSHTHSENTPPPTPSLHEDGNESPESPAGDHSLLSSPSHQSSTVGCSISQQSDPNYSTSPSVSVHERRRPNVRINSRPTKW